jgi:RsiW-degrading membrane proteinase PrsW (M82 family)
VVLAFFLGFMMLVGLGIAAAAWLALQPGGTELLQTLSDRLQDPAAMPDLERLVRLATSTPMAIAILLVVAGMVPLIEESVKTLGVGLLSTRKPGPARALLWGLTCGAGFALVEGLLNTLGAAGGWALIMMLRVAATLLHCFAGALVGLAWYYMLQRHHWLRIAGLYAAAVGVHMLWNSISATLSLISLRALGESLPALSQVVTSVQVLVLLVSLVVVAGAIALGLFGLVRYVQKLEPASAPDPVESEG